jgi:hypothetical protein
VVFVFASIGKNPCENEGLVFRDTKKMNTYKGEGRVMLEREEKNPGGAKRLSPCTA